MTGLPLHGGINEVIFKVKDEAGNIAMTFVSINYAAPSVVPSFTADMLQPQENKANNVVSITLPSVSGVPAANECIINGERVWVIGSNYIKISFNASKMPANTFYYSYSLDGVSFSDYIPVGNDLFIPLQNSEMNLVYFVFANSSKVKNPDVIKLKLIVDTVKPSVAINNINNISATSNSYYNIQLVLSDNLSSTFEWSTDQLSWTAVPDSKNVLLNLNDGLNLITIYVKDTAGNVNTTPFEMWKL